MRGAVERYQLANLPRHRDYIAGRRVVDKKSIFPLADGKMRGLVDLRRQQLQLLIGNPDQHVAPVVAMGEAPHGRAENVILPARRTGKKSTSPERIRQPEGAAAVNPQQLRKFSERDRLLGKSDRLQNRKPAIKALDEWDLTNFVLGHKEESGTKLTTLLPASPGKL